MKNKDLPNFLIIGAAKCGTTSIHSYLSQHPDVFMSQIKEPHFFADFDPKTINRMSGKYGTNKITSLTAYLELFQNTNGQKIRGESSVSTLYYPNAIKTVKKILGDPKILIILRNPVDRAYSNYLHHVRDSFESLSFEEALNQEKAREQDNYWWGYQFRKAGLYYKQVTNIYNYMPKDNVKVVLFENFIKNKGNALSEICAFLGISDNFEFNTNTIGNKTGIPKDNWQTKTFSRFFKSENHVKNILKPLIPKHLRQNIRSKAKEQLFDKNLVKPQMNPETRKMLIEYFREDILNLQSLIDRDLSNWLK